MPTTSEYSPEQGYLDALILAKKHYENFPVVSLLVPKSLKKHIAIIYWFARTADDFADEGNLSVEERLNSLNKFEERLSSLLSGEMKNNLESALFNTINSKKLTHKYFYDLLIAFKQDVTKHKYANFIELLNYCKYSANPVGRIILELFDERIEEYYYYSDKICTSLQLTNFFQDTLIDYKKGRIYYPIDEMEKFGVTEKMFELRKNNFNLRQMVQYNVERTQKLFDEGKNLLSKFNGRLKIEIAWTIHGGEAVLNKIRKNNFDVR